jgi:multidrug efflux pump subunit AcrA (membrane-fusion protein)
MKPKSILIGIIVALCAGLGIYHLVKSRGTASASAGEETTPTVVSVQVGALKRMTLRRYVTGYGTVEVAPATADQPAAGAQLAAPSAGVVARVNIVEGQRVKKGDVLVKLNSGMATFAYARDEVERQKKLFAQQNTSLKALQNAEAQLDSLRVIAPLSGTVTRLNVKPGESVDVNTTVAEVMDLSRLVVKTAIPESQAGELEPGQEVRVLTDPPVTAPLGYVSPTVDTNSSTVLARAALPADRGLRPGQFVSLRIVTAIHTNCLAAPDASVVTDINGQSVIALVHGDEAAQTPVQTGFRENGWVEVAGTGLKAGDSVVTVGAYGLPDKTKIQVVNPAGDETSATNSYSSQGQ